MTDRIPSYGTAVPNELTAPRSRRERRALEAAAAPAAAAFVRVAAAEAPQPTGAVREPNATRAATTVRKPGRMRPLLAMGFVAALVATTAIPAVAAFLPGDASAALASASLGDGAAPTEGKQSVDSSADVLTAAEAPENYKSLSRDQMIRTTGLNAADTFTNDPNGTIQWPFLIGVRLSDGFGPRAVMCNGGGCTMPFHKGQDFDAGDGAPIQAIADGTVITSTDNNGGGVLIEIEHHINGQTVVSEYMHMRYGSRKVQVGDQVKVGQVIGLVGNTGMSFGAHLHLEIYVNGTPVDPLKWLRANAN